MDELDPVRRLRADHPEPTEEAIAAGRARLVNAIRERNGRRRRRGRLIAAGVVTAAVAASCLASVTIGPRGGGPGMVAPASAEALTPFDDCAAVRDWYVGAALPHVTAWGLDTGSGMPVPDIGFDVRRGTTELAPEDEIDGVGNGSTGTNVQEAGVDEPDIAKTDGEIVVALRGSTLVVSDVTGDEPVELGRVNVPGARGGDLLLIDDRVIVTNTPNPIIHRRILPVLDQHSYDSTISTVDLSDPASPAVEHTRTVDGSVIAAREHDGTVRIALSSTPSLRFVTPTRGRTRAQALTTNRAIVRGSSAADWLPTSRGDGVRSPLVDCSQVNHPRRKAGVGTVTVLTLDPDDPGATDTTAVAADGSLVYASADRFYVATTDGGWTWWRPIRGNGDGPSTDIHAFAIDETATRYVASGSVEGQVPDRWAFSEYDGVLRVASEQGLGWNPKETVVSTLREDGDSLEVVGSVGGMGAGEQIKSVRWFGDVGVVVTFRQTDPLYTLDLSDPTAPRVTGELKVRGYSAYLHPIGEDRLVGIGQAANARGVERGLQVSTFDLSDVTQPMLESRLGLGRRWGYSPIAHDARAFTYLPEQRLMFVPALGGGEGARVEAVRVSPAGDLDEVATYATPAWSERVRVLPVDDDRVAIVANGRILQLVPVAPA
ncbi:MAG: beta-propeller domain-containing protein [Nocardioidaceae bacterium]